MPWRVLAQVIVTGAQTVARAFGRAVQQEIKSTRQAAANQQTSSSSGGKAKSGQQTRRTAATNARHGLSLQEAVQILNVSKELNPEEVNANFKHLFEINEKSNGGSFYLQSKVFRAKERIDVELRGKQSADSEESIKNSAQKSDSSESNKDSSQN